MTAIKVNVKFPDPLQELWSKLAEIDDMPYFSTETEAGVAMLKKIRETLLDSPKKLLDFARPITTTMTQLRPSLSRQFDSRLPLRHFLLMTLISFAGSMLLRVIVVWIYHRYKHRNNATPLWCGLFCQEKPHAAVEVAQTNETQLGVVDNATREYSQMARLYLFPNKLSIKSQLMQRLKPLNARCRMLLLLSKRVFPSTTGQLMCMNTASHMVTFEANKPCILKVFFQTVEKGHLLFLISSGSFLMNSSNL